MAFTLGKLFHTDFFTLKNINIGILLIEGDYEVKGKYEQFIYHETNNILYFGDNVVLMKDKFDSKHFDVKNFLANENYEFRNLGKQIYKKHFNWEF